VQEVVLTVSLSECGDDAARVWATLDGFSVFRVFLSLSSTTGARAAGRVPHSPATRLDRWLCAHLFHTCVCLSWPIKPVLACSVQSLRVPSLLCSSCEAVHGVSFAAAR